MPRRVRSIRRWQPAESSLSAYPVCRAAPVDPSGIVLAERSGLEPELCASVCIGVYAVGLRLLQTSPTAMLRCRRATRRAGAGIARGSGRSTAGRPAWHSARSSESPLARISLTRLVGVSLRGMMPGLRVMDCRQRLLAASPHANGVACSRGGRSLGWFAPTPSTAGQV